MPLNLSSLNPTSQNATERLTLPYSYGSGLATAAWPTGTSNLLLRSSPVSSSLESLRSSSAMEIERSLLMNRIRELDRDLLASSTRPLLPLTTHRSITRQALSMPSSNSILEAAYAGRLLRMAKKQQALREQEQFLEDKITESPKDKSSNPDQAWETMFKALLRYRIRYGDCLVKEKDHPKLGRWVRNQRNRKKQGRMSPDRIERLNSIGFVWCMVHQESWEVMFSRLKKYKELHGDCLVPRSYKNDPKLGRWVDTQRNKNKDDMGEERMQQLKDIGFVWQVHQKSWDNMFERLVKYQAENGNCLVPCVYREDPKLGTWVHVQRSRRSMLSDDRRKRLDDIGFVWSVFEQKNKKEEEGM